MAAEVDIFQLGCVICSLSAWQKCHVEVPDTALLWPPVDPGTMYRGIIAKCLEGAYDDMDEVLLAFLEESTRQERRS